MEHMMAALLGIARRKQVREEFQNFSDAGGLTHKELHKILRETGAY